MLFQSWIDLLLENRLFEGIPGNSLTFMLDRMGAYEVHYRKYETIALENENLDGIGIILEGIVSIGKDTPSGDRMMMARLGTGDMFGEVAAFTGKLWTATVIAERDTTILILPPDKIMRPDHEFCAESLQLVSNMLQIVAQKAKLLNEKIEILAYKGIRKKICRYLLMQYQKKQETEFMIPFKRGEMAEYLQVSRPSLSRELVMLKKEGLIDFKGNHFKLLDLHEIASQL